ncbi:MAG: adenylate/guanylate cyclase domain-containing protein [Rhodospirillaceae bacterium]|jgi:adenylate cyclase|nr:adenylate/guanylate cyclase domain-containing protein [Rhodospirillaceae bacterium]MBT5243243.1 adenylate/guanylate cyclase domain-containing protein [Rhodospirillaceae bacterium]MBT6240823.1 adenylate/guanylate cyclase domain-containing protein [Rhodospirillaceae bacterium]
MGARLRSAFSMERLIGIAMIVGFIAVYYNDPYPVKFVRAKTFDFYQKLKPREIPEPIGKPVTIVDLDENSLTEIGRWPWSRDIVAKMVTNLTQMGAVLVAFDVVFAEPDPMNPSLIANSLGGLDEETKAKLSLLPDNDEIFAQVIKKSRVVLGQTGYWEERDADAIAPPPIKKSIALKGKKGAPHPSIWMNEFPSLVRNTPVIEKYAAGHGVFTVEGEPDGIIRRVPTVFKYGEDMYPALSVEMMRVAFNRPTIQLRYDHAGIRSIGIASKRMFPPNGLILPTDSNGRVWPYFSKRDPTKYVSARDVLSGNVKPEMIRGKLIIVGTSAAGLLDIRSTPIDPIIPGVEVHAQLIEAAMHNTYLSRPNYFNAAEMFLIIVGGLLMVILVPWVGAKWTMLLFLTVSGGAAATSWFLFAGIDFQPLPEMLPALSLKADGGLLFDAGFAAGSILLLYTTLTYSGYAKEEKQRRQTRDAFSKYLSPDMVARVAGNPGELKLGGDKRDLTLLFCDVRGFTTISEQFDAEGLTALINKLLTPLTNVILDRQGTVDKYMGDCIMAFWNAPLDDDQHAYNGCLSALAMLGEMGPLNDRLEQEAIEEGRKHIPLKVGLGLNSGECVVGNMGSDQRFDYSVLGDTVNLAARLEGQSKSYGMNVVLGPTTWGEVKDRLATIDLDFIQVKGKTSGTLIYGLMGDAELMEDPEFKKIKELISDAMDTYRAQKFDEALEMFKQIRFLGNDENGPWELEINLDVLCDLYEERIAEYKETPPAEDWDGVFIATTK